MNKEQEFINKYGNEWLPIHHECGWKGEVNINWAKKVFAQRIKEEPPEFAYDLIITCRGCGAVRGLRYACVYGECNCHQKEVKHA